MWKLILIPFSITVLIIGYTLIRSIILLNPKRPINLFLKKKSKEFKNLYERSVEVRKSDNIWYLQSFVEEIKKFRIDFAIDQIFNGDNDPKPTAEQYKRRSMLLEKIQYLESGFNKKINSLLKVKQPKTRH